MEVGAQTLHGEDDDQDTVGGPEPYSSPSCGRLLPEQCPFHKSRS